jgi:hypothetical protein
LVNAINRVKPVACAGYCLLRETQGDLLAILDAGYVEMYDDDYLMNYVYEINVDGDTFSLFESSCPLDNIPDDFFRTEESSDDDDY